MQVSVAQSSSAEHSAPTTVSPPAAHASSTQTRSAEHAVSPPQVSPGPTPLGASQPAQPVSPIASIADKEKARTTTLVFMAATGSEVEAATASVAEMARADPQRSV